MSLSQTCLLVGLALGFAVILDGFTGFLILFVFGLVGLVVGRVLEGELDLGSVLGGRTPRDR